VREITPRPFAVNHVVPLLDEAAFRVTLEAKPAGKASGRLFRPRHPGELVSRAQSSGRAVRGRRWCIRSTPSARLGGPSSWAWT
jgi:hypothetical protein